MAHQFTLKAEDAHRLAAHYPTPLYLYDEAIIHQKIDELQSLQGDWELNLRFAMKACPTAGILQVMRQRGVQIDAGSYYEVLRAQNAGYDLQEIQLTSQELPPLPELLRLIEGGMLFTACSLRQLEVYAESGCQKPIGVRFNTGIRAGEFNRTSVAGKSSSFGIWHEKISEVLSIVERSGLHIAQLHQHVGVGVDLEIWPDSVRKIFELAKQFPEVRRINLGGGLKVSRTGAEPEVCLVELQSIVANAFNDYATHAKHQPIIEFEPGTFLLAHAGAVLTRVTDIVDTGEDGYTFLKVDSGMTDILRPMMYGAQHPITHLSVRADHDMPEKSYVVVGHCCESGDVFTVRKGDPEELSPLRFHEVLPGDFLLIGGAGAYCSSMSAAHYNSYPRSAEVLRTRDGEWKLIRKREAPEEVWKDELL